MKLAAMDYVVKGSSQADVWEKAAALGLSGIEAEVRPADVRPSLENRGIDPRAEELLDLQQRTGLQIPSLCLGFHNGEGFVAQPERARECASEIALALDLCQRVGASVLLVPFFFKNDPKGDAEKLAMTVSILTPLCAHAHSLGVTLCYEGTLSAEDLHGMSHRINSKSFGVYFDLANVVWVGMDGPEQIRALGKLIRQVHMKETKVGPGDVRPGEGRVNYAESAKALKGIGYDHWLVLETPSGEPAEVARDIEFTKRFFPLSLKN
jgi:sugar phosphate isomerase/epimerase